MVATYKTKDNADSFIKVLPQDVIEACSIIIGAVDEDTDTACGVLAASAENEDTIAIRFIYVHEDYRRRGAGRIMLRALQDTALSLEAGSIVCSFFDADEEMGGVKGLLDATGFWKEDEELHLLGGDVSSFIPPSVKKAYSYKSLSGLSREEWNTFYLENEKRDNAPSPRKLYQPDCSVFAYDNGVLRGALLARPMKDGILLDDTRTGYKSENDLWYSLLDESIKRAKKISPKANVYVLPQKKIMERMLREVFQGGLKENGAVVMWTWVSSAVG